jgi:hypothetical protein
MSDPTRSVPTPSTEGVKPPSETLPPLTLAQVVIHSALHGGGMCLWSPRQLCPEYAYTAPRVIARLTEAGYHLQGDRTPDVPPEVELVCLVCNQSLADRHPHSLAEFQQKVATDMGGNGPTGTYEPSDTTGGAS